MSFIDPKGQEWISQEIYLKHIHRLSKPIIERKKYGSPHRGMIKGICKMCKKRKATTVTWYNDKVCQNCFLDTVI